MITAPLVTVGVVLGDAASAVDIGSGRQGQPHAVRAAVERVESQHVAQGALLCHAEMYRATSSYLRVNPKEFPTRRGGGVAHRASYDAISA